MKAFKKAVLLTLCLVVIVSVYYAQDDQGNFKVGHEVPWMGEQIENDLQACKIERVSTFDKNWIAIAKSAIDADVLKQVYIITIKSNAIETYPVT